MRVYTDVSVIINLSKSSCICREKLLYTKVKRSFVSWVCVGLGFNDIATIKTINVCNPIKCAFIFLLGDPCPFLWTLKIKWMWYILKIV